MFGFVNPKEFDDGQTWSCPHCQGADSCGAFRDGRPVYACAGSAASQKPACGYWEHAHEPRAQGMV